MKKFILVFFLLSIISKEILSQSKTVSLQIGEKSVIKQLFQTQDSGFMVLTGHDPKYGYVPAKKSKDYMMHLYDSKLNEVWNYEPGQDWYENFVSSKVTDYKYWFTYKNDYDDNVPFQNSSKRTKIKRFNFTRFNQKGFVDKIDSKIDEANDKYNLISAFSDKNSFHLITNNMMIGAGKKEMVPEVPYIYSISHKEGKKFTKKKININLEEGGTFGYLGFNEDKIYLYQQRFVSVNLVTITIFIINAEGELLKEFEIVNKSSEGKYFRSMLYIREFMGDYINNINISAFNSSIATYNCIGELKIDFSNLSIHFISFLIDDKKVASDGSDLSIITNIFISKYNLEGEKIKTKEFDFLSVVESAGEYNKLMKQTKFASIYFHSIDKFIIKIKGGHNKEVSFFISTKEAKVFENSSIKLYNLEDIYYATLKGYFTTVGNDISIKNKNIVKYLSNLEKEEFKKSSFLALNIDNKYFLFQYTKSKGENILDIKLFD